MNLRVPLGFLFAPIIPCAAVVLPGIIGRPEWTRGWVVIALMILVSQLVSLLAAVPIYFIVRRYWRVCLTQCLLSGFAIGAVVFFVTRLAIVVTSINSSTSSGGPTVIGGHYTAHGWVQYVGFAGYSALFGASIGLIFWLVAIWSPLRQSNEP
jgi:hypothetical protein